LRAVGAGIRRGWLLLGITLILIVVCEAGLRLALTAGDRLMDRQPPVERGTDGAALVEVHHGVEWKREYSKAFDDEVRRYVWQPYVYWRHALHQGRYFKVDRDGLRATWSPPPRDGGAGPPPVRVFTFGGSTLWGWGGRDDHTIPSYLSKLLHEQGYRAEVTNYGQLDYVSTQEVIALLRCIQRGEVPDIVLFYDSLNDVFASYKNGEAGVSITEGLRRTEFNLNRRPKQLMRVWKQEVLARYFRGFHRLTAGLQRRIRPRTAPLPHDDALVRQTVRLYEVNLTLVESMGRSYGFDPLFYWQPVAFSRPYRSPHERYGAERFSFSEQMLEAVYQRIRRSEALNSRPHFHDISALFDDSGEAYYLDGMQHLSEAGNQRVAAAMVDDVIRLIEQRRAAAAEKTVR